jgi:hypothetical protein
MDLDPSYDVYRALFPDRKIPPREREFLEKMFTLDVSRLNGVATRFPAYEELLDLLKAECCDPGEGTLINGDAARGRAKELLAKWLNIRNRNGKPYTEKDDRARDTSLRIGLCRKLGLLVIAVGDRERSICMLDGPLGGFMYFDDRKEIISRAARLDAESRQR